LGGRDKLRVTQIKKDMYIKTEIQRTKIIEEGDNIKKIKRGTKTKERDIKGSG
jgi:hypothetical protein